MNFMDNFEKRVQGIKDNRTSVIADLYSKIQEAVKGRDEQVEKLNRYLISGTPDQVSTARATIDQKDALVEMYQDKIKEIEATPLVTPDEYGALFKEIINHYGSRELIAYRNLKAAVENVQTAIDNIKAVDAEVHDCANMVKALRPTPQLDMYGNHHPDNYDYAAGGDPTKWGFTISDYIREPLTDMGAKRMIDSYINELEAKYGA